MAYGKTNVIGGYTGRSTSGVKASENSQLQFLDRDNVGVSAGQLIVTGLGFKPSRVAIKTNLLPSTTRHATSFFDGFDFANTAYAVPILFQNDESSARMYQLDGTLAYITNDGFRLPVRAAGVDYYWEAYE